MTNTIHSIKCIGTEQNFFVENSEEVSNISNAKMSLQCTDIQYKYEMYGAVLELAVWKVDMLCDTEMLVSRVKNMSENLQRDIQRKR